MIRRKVTEEQVQIRERIMAELGDIPALTPAAQKLLTAEGFLSYFLELRQLFPTYEEAYEELEAQHERITGRWMYAEYDTFRRVYKRWMKKKNAHRK